MSVAFEPRPPAAAPARPPIPRWIERVAWLLDEAFPIPFTRFRFGLDALLGLIPGAGDVVPAVFGLAIIVAAARLRVPRLVIARMGLALAADALLGMVPVAGDVGDVLFKANRRNLEALRRHAHGAAPPTAADRLVVGGVIALVVLVALAGAAVLVAVIAWIASHPW